MIPKATSRKLIPANEIGWLYDDAADNATEDKFPIKPIGVSCTCSLLAREAQVEDD